jgi:hypothetical protein
MIMRIVKYPHKTLTTETTVNTSGLILNNKVVVPFTDSQFVLLSAVNPVIFEFDKSKNLRSSVSVTNHVSITNANADNDYNDSTAASTSDIGDFRTYDLGAIKNVFLNIRHGADSGQMSVIRISNDNSTWTEISSVSNNATAWVSGLYTCRYIRWAGSATTGSKNLYTVEIFDINNYTERTNATGNSVIEHAIVTKNDIHWICIKADSMMTYYQYKISRFAKIVDEVDVI